MTKFLLVILFLWFVMPLILQKLAQGSLAGRTSGVYRQGNLFNLFAPLFGRMRDAGSTMNTSGSKIRSAVTGGGHTWKWAVAAVIVVVFLINAVRVVPAGQTGVVVLFGKTDEREVSSGLHLVNPLARVIMMSVRTEEYTMSVAHGEGQRKGADAIQALTKEGLNVDLDITVLYKLQEDSASDVYKDLGLGYAEKIIRPEIRSVIREVVALYDAKAIYSDKRDEVRGEILTRLAASLDERGITVEQVLLRNVTLPKNLAGSIEQKLQAEQESQRHDFLIEKEKKEAERKRIEAEGQRDAQAIVDQSLTPAYLQYLYVNGLKEREGTIYVPTDPSSGLPVFRGIR